MKTIKVKPVESIAIELNDKTYTCTFNMLAMAYMQEALASLGEMKIDEVSPARFASMVLYAGIRANDESITMEEANALAIQMGPANYGYIVDLYMKSMIDSMNEKDSKELKKTMAQILSSVPKPISK